MSKLLVYNIRKEKYASKLTASGVANRWNLDNQYIIYSASSRALATLELVVHKSAIAVNLDYKVLVIELNVTEKDIFTLDNKLLPQNWKSMAAYYQLQKIGSIWYQSKKELLMKVPSAVIPQEFNYLINTQHPDFIKKVKLKTLENFAWDERLF
jgi:RES domain-containing protein